MKYSKHEIKLTLNVFIMFNYKIVFIVSNLT